MIALNKVLQQAGIKTGLYFIHVCKSPSGAIIALISEKANVSQLIPR